MYSMVSRESFLEVTAPGLGCARPHAWEILAASRFGLFLCFSKHGRPHMYPEIMKGGNPVAPYSYSCR